MRQRQSALAEIGLAQVRIEEQQRDLARLDAAIELTMADVAADVIDDVELAMIRGEVELHVDLAERMVTRASWAGEANGSGDNRGIEIALSLRIRAEATAKTGAHVIKSLNKKPRFKNNKHVSKDGAVSFALPSPLTAFLVVA